MNKIRKFSTALILTGFVATGMLASSAQLHASGFGGGSKTSLCRLLAYAYSSVSALPDSEYKAAVLQAIADKQASLGCQ